MFKYIDPNDEEKPFVFTVSITNQGIYSGNVFSKYLYYVYEIKSVAGVIYFKEWKFN